MAGYRANWFDVQSAFPESVKARCNGDSLRAGKSSWQVDYRVSDVQQVSQVARVWTWGRALRVRE
jgi:hypothetical protein